MVLYGIGTFYPQQLGTVYHANAILTAVYLLPYELTICFAGFLGGLLVTRLRKFRWILVLLLALLALFCGLQAINQPNTLSVAVGLGVGVGLGSALLLVVPVAGVATCVPSQLIGTSLTLLSCCRGIGGTIGITIFASVYGDKISGYVPDYVGSVALSAGLSVTSVTLIFEALTAKNETALFVIPGMTPFLADSINEAYDQAVSDSFKFVWLSIMAVTAAGVIVACFLREISHKMTNFVESALEDNEIRHRQYHKA